MKTWLCLSLFLVCVPRYGAAQPGEAAPIVIQGAMASETERLIAQLQQPVIEQIGSWSFWRGSIDGQPVVVSRTNKGMANAAAATVLAIERYKPAAIINQGTSGGHDPALNVFDIVIGASAVNLAFKSPFRPSGTGSQPLGWLPMDLLAEGSAGSGPPRQLTRFQADSQLMAIARGAADRYTQGRVVDGVIGSADAWMDEVDLVSHFNKSYGTSVEEMETAAAAQIATAMKVPFVGIRILSDNITNGGTYNPRTGEACQEFVLHVVRAYRAAQVAPVRIAAP